MSENKTYIQQAIYYLLQENAFVGNLLQELEIRLSDEIPTAALRYDKDDSKFEVLINDKFFKALSLEHRVGVFFHEILHFTHGHLFRFDNIGSAKDMMLKNIAADMAINQYIKSLPDDCVRHSDWKDQKGQPFPDYQTMETYFQLLEQTTQPPESGDGNEPDDADGAGQGNQGTKTKNGEKNAKKEVGQQSNWNRYNKYNMFDEHGWGDLSDDEKQRLFQEAKKVVTRSVEKAYKDYSTMPDSVKELLQNIDAQIKKLNYKALLKQAIKRTLTTQDRTHTWYRPNKRYGSYAPGTTYDKAPFINVYIDTSGSISHTELNEFLAVMDGFLKNSAKKCNLGLWHTELYSLKKWKLKNTFDRNNVQAGGTDPECVFKHMEETKPNLSIILTDGCYGRGKINPTQKCIFVISKNGTEQHPYMDVGVTVKMQGLI